MIRRLASALTAIALVYAMAAPPVSACESAHGTRTDLAGAILQGPGDGHAAHQPDCPESAAPTGQEHDSDCLVTCLSMVGCSPPSFVVESTQLSMIDQGSPVLSTATQPYPSRSLAPDRPPPRS